MVSHVVFLGFVVTGNLAFRDTIYYNTNSITSLGTTGTISGQYYDYADYSVSTSKSFSWYINGVEPGTDGSSWLFGSKDTNFIK